MDVVLQLARWEIIIFLAGLAAIVVYQLLNGKINTRYLLYGRIAAAGSSDRDANLQFSPARVQLLVFTLGAALYYLMQSTATANSGQLPDIPEGWPAAIGASNAIYLAGKAYARWFANRTR
jgi:hypothetical protein